NVLTLTLEDGGTQTVDFTTVLAAAGTDDQALTLAAGNILTLEDGGTVDLTAFLDNTDNQTITTFSLDNTTNVLTLTLEDGGTQTVDFTTVLAAAGTDDQALTLAAGNILTLEDGGTVDLTAFLDNTDNQTGAEVAITDAAGNFTSTEVEGALAELAAGSTDDQALTLAAGNILTLEDGGTVDLSAYVDTDDQNLTSAVVIANESVEIQINDGTNTTIDIRDADSNASNEIQTITSTDGSVTVTPSGINYNLSVPSADPTVVTAGTDISVTGDGSTATPYVIANTRPDIFYPPSIEVDVATTGTGRTIDLHAEYLAQYGTPTVVSAGAPVAIPTYANNELYYYVTYYDPAVFANVSVNNVGVMTYDVIASPTDYNTLINVVFVAQ
ncbi:hypothetical protein SAMN04488008_108141, partial [Maribacter orientalis]